jgi:menaquinone-dependent protoporphyrinogen oxidase
VIPTSKHGGTAEIGRVIATALRGHGIDVDVSQPEHMFKPADYDGYIIGSAIYLGDWIDRARSFVDQHAEVIARKPTWLFSSGPLGDSMPETPIQPEVVEHLMSATGACSADESSTTS